MWFHFARRGNKDDGISFSFRTLDITLFDKALWYFSPSEVDQGRPPIKVKFEIPYFTVSGIQVTYYKTVVPLIILVINKSDSRLAVVRGRSRSFAVVRGRSILFITRKITYRIGLYSVLAPLYMCGIYIVSGDARLLGMSVLHFVMKIVYHYLR